MANSVQFTVDDTSPTILYSPFADTLSTPDLSLGWNPYYTLSGFASVLGEIGNGTSLHITSNNGSSLFIQWHGTGIQLWGNVTLASYSITLDGASCTQPDPSDNNVLATIDGLTDALHTVTLTAIIPAVQDPPNSSMVAFEKAIITSSPLPPNETLSLRTINDNDIAFMGRWSFQTDLSGASFHSSQTLGDRAVTSFNGTTFLLQGVTSPTSGNYTVTVDDVTTSLSASSSFTSYDSLLFFVTGLDPLSVHNVQIVNSDGSDLSLLIGGFNTFVASPPPSPSVVTIRRSFPQGTIAALVLGGILACIILSSLIFYFFVYRPRKRRRRQRALAQLRRRSPKEYEAGVIDIGPETDKTTEVGSPLSPDQLDGSVANGYLRWRRGAVDGSPGSQSLPLCFRHSDSTDEKLPSPLNEVPLDDLSSSSSARRKARAKSKGKARQITGISWPPEATLDLPVLRRLRPQSTVRHSAPTAESLGYVSTFVAAEPSSPQNVAPPSYAASVSIRESTTSRTNLNSNTTPSSDHLSNIPSVPHSVSAFTGDHDRFYPPQKQDENRTFLLPSGELNSEPSSSTDSSPHLLKPPQAIPMRPLTREDQAHVLQDNSDDNQNSHSPTSLQQAIRSLSPRTARHPYAASQDSIPSPPSPQEANLLHDNAILTLLPSLPSHDDDLVEVRDGVFLSVNMPSPLRLTFDAKRIRSPISDSSNPGGLGSQGRPPRHFSDRSEPPNPDNSISAPVGMPTTTTSPDFVQGASNMRFRLTPLSIPPTSFVAHSPNRESEGVNSFLDFTSSREGSFTSHSVKANWPEERQRNSLYPGTVELKSRWSNTTAPSLMSKASNNRNSSGTSGNGSSTSPLDSQSFAVPVRLSIPTSTYHTSRRSRVSGLTENLHLHPTLEGLESPTESVSMSVSELHFRQSVSEENMGASNSRRTTESSLVFVSSHAPPPPPLPTRHDEFIPRPFDPSILVNRVLGLPSPASASTVTAARSAAGGGSAAASSPAVPYDLSPDLLLAPSPPNPLTSSSTSLAASRNVTNTRGDPSNSQNPGT